MQGIHQWARSVLYHVTKDYVTWSTDVDIVRRYVLALKPLDMTHKSLSSQPIRVTKYLVSNSWHLLWNLKIIHKLYMWCLEPTKRDCAWGEHKLANNKGFYEGRRKIDTWPRSRIFLEIASNVTFPHFLRSLLKKSSFKSEHTSTCWPSPADWPSLSATFPSHSLFWDLSSVIISLAWIREVFYAATFYLFFTPFLTS